MSEEQALYDTPTVEDSYLQADGFEEVGTPAQIASLYGALAEAQSEFSAVKRSKRVTIRLAGGAGYEFAYAPLEDLLAATRPALGKHGIAVLTPMLRVADSTTARVVVILAHKDGARIASSFEFLPAGDIKQMAGQVTYVRRYGYSALLNLAADDDADDNDAPMPKPPPQRSSAQQRRQATDSAPKESGPAQSFIFTMDSRKPEEPELASPEHLLRYQQLLREGAAYDLDMASYEIDGATITRDDIGVRGKRLAEVVGAERAKRAAQQLAEAGL